MKVKGVVVDGLNKRQIGAMKKHARHHTQKHLRSMVSSMKRGKMSGAYWANKVKWSPSKTRRK